MIAVRHPTREYWDAQAASFDKEVDHGLRGPGVRDAWAALLLPQLPPAPAQVLDLGCGTGSIAVLLAEANYDVHGIDFSQPMIDVATAKATGAGVTAQFHCGDAATPPYEPESFEVVFIRHLLWAMPDPDAAIAAWVRLLRPFGSLVLVEGQWTTGAGISSAACRSLVLNHRREATIRQLDDPTLWGKAITDDRYLITSHH